jgi:hypothetical protein
MLLPRLELFKHMIYYVDLASCVCGRRDNISLYDSFTEVRRGLLNSYLVHKSDEDFFFADQFIKINRLLAR